MKTRTKKQCNRKDQEQRKSWEISIGELAWPGGNVGRLAGVVPGGSEAQPQHETKSEARKQELTALRNRILHCTVTLRDEQPMLLAALQTAQLPGRLRLPPSHFPPAPHLSACSASVDRPAALQ
jgi:hypothetical protein